MTDHLVRAAALQGIRSTIEELGGDADALFAQAHLTEAEHDRDAWISYRSFLLLLEQSAIATDCAYFACSCRAGRALASWAPGGT